MKSKSIIALYLFLILINMFSLISAEINISSPEYLKVLNEFNKSEWISVIIGVDSKEVREGVINSLSENEFKIGSKSLLGKSFSGKINRHSLDKLVNNSNVKWVNLEETLSIENNVTSKKNSIVSKNLNYYYLLLIIIGIVILIWIKLKLNKIKKR